MRRSRSLPLPSCRSDGPRYLGTSAHPRLTRLKLKNTFYHFDEEDATPPHTPTSTDVRTRQPLPTMRTDPTAAAPLQFDEYAAPPHTPTFSEEKAAPPHTPTSYDDADPTAAAPSSTEYHAEATQRCLTCNTEKVQYACGHLDYSSLECLPWYFSHLNERTWCIPEAASYEVANAGDHKVNGKYQIVHGAGRHWFQQSCGEHRLYFYTAFGDWADGWWYICSAAQIEYWIYCAPGKFSAPPLNGWQIARGEFSVPGKAPAPALREVPLYDVEYPNGERGSAIDVEDHMNHPPTGWKYRVLNDDGCRPFKTGTKIVLQEVQIRGRWQLVCTVEEDSVSKAAAKADRFAQCSKCRPESRCRHPGSRACYKMATRGRCNQGAKCNFCHLHPKEKYCDPMACKAERSDTVTLSLDTVLADGCDLNGETQQQWQ